VQGLVGGVRPMVGRVRVFLLACAWVLLSHGNSVPLHFSFPLADEVLFGNNIRIVWRYDVRCACELWPPAESKAAHLHERHFTGRNASAATILLNGNVIFDGAVWGEGLVQSASRATNRARSGAMTDR
jgi:hypothetical protein